MATTHIAFDTRSGQILTVHHGAVDAKAVWRGGQHHAQLQGPRGTVISDEYVDVLTVPSDAVEPGKQYKVDVSSKTLVATEGKGGVSFGFGATARSSAPA